MTEAVMDGMQVNKSTVRLTREDITDLDIQAFVFYAQPDLALGSGFGGAISVRGGPSVQKELDEMGPVATGDAIVSGAGKLKSEYIIHAVGPRFREEDIEGKLRTTMRSCLARAEERGIERIAFPAMGAGYYGIPAPLCAKVMLEVIGQHLQGDTCIKDVVICVLDTNQYDSFKAAMAAS
jgi:O-acetyl-ADP-ribose deacetylase (regulator of RNase III)